MKKILAAGAALMFALAGAPAIAQEWPAGWSASVGYTHFDLYDVDVGGLTGRAAWRFHPNVGIEGEASFGVNDDEIAGVDVELDHHYGIYAVGYAPLMNESIDLFARIGYADIEAVADIGGFRVGAEEDGFSWGLGARWRFTDALGIRTEYTRLDDIDMWGVSLASRF